MRTLGSILVVLIVAHLGSQQPVGAQDSTTDRQRNVDRYMPWIAASLAVTGAAFLFANAGRNIGAEVAMFEPGTEPWQVLVISIPATAAFAATTWVTSRWYGRVIMRRPENWWSAALLGAGVGTATGAAIGTSGQLVTMTMGHAMGVIDTGAIGEAGILAVAGMTAVSFGLWGALIGVLPGAVGGPVLYRYTRP